MRTITQRLSTALLAALLAASFACAEIALDSFARRLGAEASIDEITGRATITDGLNIMQIAPEMAMATVNGRPVGLSAAPRWNGQELALPNDAVATMQRLWKVPPPTPGPSIQTVVIDPGHGGHDSGAIGKGGLTEKEVNLAIARRLESRLKRAGFTVVMTRTGDRFLGLDERAAVANRARADLFISIHANGSSSRSAKGYETYYVRESYKGVDLYDRAARAARAGDLPEAQVGAEGPIAATDEAAVYGVLLEECRQESRELAGLIQRQLSGIAITPNRGVKIAAYRVLIGVRCPAVLIEVGFISNAATEQKLRSADHRDAIARAIAEAVVQFRARMQKEWAG